jgi:hypothetical protein
VSPAGRPGFRNLACGPATFAWFRDQKRARNPRLVAVPCNRVSTVNTD